MSRLELAARLWYKWCHTTQANLTLVGFNVIISVHTTASTELYSYRKDLDLVRLLLALKMMFSNLGSTSDS